MGGCGCCCGFSVRVGDGTVLLSEKIDSSKRSFSTAAVDDVVLLAARSAAVDVVGDVIMPPSDGRCRLLPFATGSGEE